MIEVNELQKRRVLGKLERHLGTVRGKTIALLGLAFKPNTDDMREAPSLVLAGRLISEGAAVRALGPGRADRTACAASSSSTPSPRRSPGADAAVIVTEWPELAGLDWAAVASDDADAVLIDGRNMLDPEDDARRRLPLRGDRPRGPTTAARLRVDAIILAGGKAERLGDAAQGKPKSLVPSRGVRSPPTRSAGFGSRCARVIVSCAAGQERPVRGGAGRPRRRRRRPRSRSGSGAAAAIRFAARGSRETVDVFALNGDELLDVDLAGLLDASPRAGPPRRSRSRSLLAFGVVDVGDDDFVSGFREAAGCPYWVNFGGYVLDDEALGRLPERGDHEPTTFPELAAEGKLLAWRHEGCG